MEYWCVPSAGAETPQKRMMWPTGSRVPGQTEVVESLTGASDCRCMCSRDC